MNSSAGTIVVGIDASESSLRALAWAVKRAQAEHRAITLVHAIELCTPAYADAVAVYPEQARDALRAEGRDALGAARAMVERTAPDLEVHEVFRFDDPREVLMDLSESASLLVIGSRGRGRIRSLLLGSVGVALARHAQCPIVVHRPGNQGLVRKGVLVGADGSEGSRAVLEFAYREASLAHLPLTVLHCFWDVGAGSLGGYVVPETLVDLEAERLLLAESMAGMSEKYPDVRVRTELTRGLPQDALVRLGDRMNLVVVGTRQAGTLSQMLSGSVSIAVVEHARCPVAVVPVASSL